METCIKHSLSEILILARQSQASDVHLSVNNPMIFRKFGSLIPQTNEKLSPEAMESLIRSSLDENLMSEFLKTGDLEFVYTVDTAGRFRMTLIKHRLGWDLTARIIPMTILPFKESGMPDSCQSLTKWAQGLVLIT